MRRRAVLTAIATLAALPLLPIAGPMPAHAETPPPPKLGLRDRPPLQFSQDTDTIIVTFDRHQSDAEQAAIDAIAGAAGSIAGAEVVKAEPITDRTVAVTLDQTLSADEAAQVGDLAADEAGVRAAEPEATLTPEATDDPHYNYLWNLREQSPSDYGVDAETAWSASDGESAIVGIVDTGITNHPDLNANVVAGYDFISDPAQSGDADGPDADPSDPGDYCATTGSKSSWHGTHVAGIVGAIADNSTGVVGVAPGAKLEPLRALGRCGGSEGDVIAAIRWGAGLSVVGLPANPKPVDVLNLSLGGNASCSTAMQDAINAAVGKGVPVVVAAGNAGQPLSTSMPANCQNVIRVVASTFEGTRAPYSNFGSTGYAATVAAPGGSGRDGGNANDWIISTWNTGTSEVGSASYAGMVGTSMAAPHVAGIAALLKGADPGASPARIASVLRDTATRLPECSTTACGDGVVNARRALNALLGDPAGRCQATVTGPHLVGHTLTATNSCRSGVTVERQWLRDGTPVSGATQTSYPLTAADAGRKVALRQTASYLGETGSVTTDALTVYPSLAASLPTPVVSGQAIVGGTLSFNRSATSFGTDAVEWLRDGKPTGATGTSVRLGPGDLGHQYAIRRTLSFEGEKHAQTSPAVTVAANPVTRLARPTVSGTATVAKTLTTTAGGATGATYKYQWLRSGVPIPAATGPSYTLTPSDRGRAVSVRVTASYLGQQAAQTSLPTAAVAPARFAPTKAPKTSGTYRTGKTLKASAGAMTPSPTTVRYQWLRNGKPISKATSKSYRLKAADKGKRVSVRVTAARPGYVWWVAYSASHKIR